MLRPNLHCKSLQGRRGFTLIEMMIVVTIIAMMAALGAPSIIGIMRDRKTQRDALSMLIMIQDAHSRSVGRGGATFVTYTEGASAAVPDSIDIREATIDVDGAGTADIPTPRCAGAGVVLSPVLKYWQTSDREKPTQVALNRNGQGGPGFLAAGSTYRVCFMPRGNARFLNGGVYTTMNEALTFQFTAAATSSALFQNNRFVYLYPNGTSRLRI